jgi:integrase
MNEQKSERKPKRERGTGRIWQKGEIWWIQFYDHGRQVRESSGSTDERDAKRLLRRRLGEVALGMHCRAREVSYEEIRDAFFLDYQTKHRKSLYFDKEGKPRLDKVEHLNGFFAGYRVSEITTDAMRRFAKKLQERGKRDSTVNRSLSVLRRMLNLARRERKILDVPFVPMLKEPPAREGFFEPASYEALLAALPEYLRLPLAIAYHTAMRAGEVLSLRWDQIDFLGNTITLRAGETKNDEARTIPIVPVLRALLEEQHSRRQAGFPYVCFWRNKKGRVRQIGNFRKAWYRACEKAGVGRMGPARDPVTGNLVYEKNSGSRPKPKLVYNGLIFHDLRRSGVRNLVRAGVPERVAMAISGHKTRAVFDRYNIVSGHDLNEAAQKLDGYLTAQRNGANSGQMSKREEPPKSEPHVVQ